MTSKLSNLEAAMAHAIRAVDRLRYQRPTASAMHATCQAAARFLAAVKEAHDDTLPPYAATEAKALELALHRLKEADRRRHNGRT